MVAQAAQALAQKQHTQQDIEQWIDEITQAGIQQMIIVHRPDKQQPVAGHQQGGEGQHGQMFGVAQHRFYPVAPAADKQHGQQ